MQPVISAYLIRSLSSLTSGLRLAADGPELDICTTPRSLFNVTTHPRPTREVQIMELYDDLRPSLLMYLAGLGLNLNESEDVIHDTFVRLFDHLSARSDDPNLRGWLFRVAHNLAIDLFRETKRIQLPGIDGVNLLEFVIDSSFGPEEYAIKNEEIRKVASALERLTPQQRSAVLLRAEDLRYREIAVVLGVSIKRVSELVQRALTLLAGNL